MREHRKPSHPTIALIAGIRLQHNGWLNMDQEKKKDCMQHNNLSHLQIKYFFSVSIHFAFRSRQTSLPSLVEDFLFKNI